MNLRRGSVLIVVILVVAIAAVAGFYFVGIQGTGISLIPQPTVTTATPKPIPSSSPDVTANWKTYRNEKYGYEIKYPPNWNSKESQSRLVIIKEVTNLQMDTKPYVSIEVAENKNNLHLDEWLSENSESMGHEQRRLQLNNMFSKPNNIEEPQKIFLDNQTAYRWQLEGLVLVIVDKDRTIYQIGLTTLDPQNTNIEGAIKTYNQILSTFKFIDSIKGDTKTEIKEFVDKYMQAVITKDKSLIQTYIYKINESGFTIKNMMDIMTSYDVNKYEILSIKDKPDKYNAYYAIVRMYNSKGDIMKNPEGDPTLMLFKENGQWKSNTWYFFQ